MVVHPHNPTTVEAETGELQFIGQPASPNQKSPDPNERPGLQNQSGYSYHEEHLRIISDFYKHIKSYPPSRKTIPTQVQIYIVVVSIGMVPIGPYIWMISY